MDTNRTPDQGKQSDPDQGNPLPKEITLKYNIEPINQLTHAINQQTTKQEQGKDDPKSGANRQASAQERANRIYRQSLYVNTFIFLATLGIFCFTIKSANAAKDAADAAKDAVTLARKNFEVENEAIFACYSLVTKQPRKNHFEFVAFAKNYGKTIVLMESHKVNAIVTDSSKITQFPYPPKSFGDSAAFPSPSGVPMDINDSINITDAEAIDYFQFKKHIFFYGEIDYYDIAIRKYCVFNFCFDIIPGLNNIPKFHNGTIRDSVSTELPDY